MLEALQSLEHPGKIMAKGILTVSRGEKRRQILMMPMKVKQLFYTGPSLLAVKAKQLSKGLLELGEEGAIQVFETVVGNTLLLGAVGQLQFEVVAARLASEYKVDAVYDDAGIATARWLTYPDDKVRRDFERDRAATLATDVDGNPVYLAPNRFNLQVAMERWPQVGFHATREHGQRMTHQ